jgi:hypothetical protein
LNDLFGVTLATIGTTSITLGLVLAWMLIVGVVFYFYNRVKGRG